MLATAAGPAAAHGGLADAPSIANGALHLLLSPLSIAALLGLVAVLAGPKRQLFLASATVVLVCAAALGVVATKGVPGWLAAGLVTLVGLLAASGYTATSGPKPWLVWLVSAGAGLAAGLASDLDSLAWQPVAGACAVLGVTVVALVAGSEDLYGVTRLQKILPIAQRVLGAWVAALGLLLGALALRVGI